MVGYGVKLFECFHLVCKMQQRVTSPPFLHMRVKYGRSTNMYMIKIFLATEVPVTHIVHFL